MPSGEPELSPVERARDIEEKIKAFVTSSPFNRMPSSREQIIAEMGYQAVAPILQPYFREMACRYRLNIKTRLPSLVVVFAGSGSPVNTVSR